MVSLVLINKKYIHFILYCFSFVQWNLVIFMYFVIWSAVALIFTVIFNINYPNIYLLILMFIMGTKIHSLYEWNKLIENGVLYSKYETEVLGE